MPNKEEADRLYFAYGSNINLEQMAYRCPAATIVGPAVLENYELLFRRGYATIKPRKGGKVHGLLWTLTPICEQTLDMYEGYPRTYDKQMVTVRDGSGQDLSVLVYIMDERFRDPTMPHPGYYDIIVEGYRQNGLPEAALKKALDHAVREVYHGAGRGRVKTTDRSKPPKRRGGHER